MGQKVHPFGFRVGVTEAHKSRWYAPKALYGELLVEDFHIREYVDKRLNRTPPFAAVSDIPSSGPVRSSPSPQDRLVRAGHRSQGIEIDKLTGDLQALTGRKVRVKILEIRSPDTDAMLVAEAIGEQMKKRANFRRLLKQRCESAMQAGAKGVRIQVSGRLGGAEMSRKFVTREGSIPLSTLQANVDYALVHSHTSYGTIGVKVWIYKGMYTDAEEEQLDSKAAGARARARGRR